MSAADGGTKAVGDAEERIDFQGFRANVERATETAGVMDGGIQAEARTPPAMERNLFLSALANGKLEVTVLPLLSLAPVVGVIM